MTIDVKICGITSEDAMEAAVENGATFVGLVFFPPSPRSVSAEQAAELLDLLPEGVVKVGLFVDPDDALLDEVLTRVRLDMVQLHGREPPERVDAIRQEFAVQVMKAIPVATAADLDAADAYVDVADWLLFDAKPPPGADRPGGNATAFDWSLLGGRDWPLPWMLAGGLDAGNVAEAVRRSGAGAVDVSSGVEDRPGHKNPEKIAAFLEAVHGIPTP
ncbi:MAG: phosphoribosylanthranilate isomerase [Alphaproteobacteria bacterium]|nr:phosphoribosylanthranilate isomerase [Alphaproteobacteria bacterium]